MTESWSKSYQDTNDLIPISVWVVVIKLHYYQQSVVVVSKEKIEMYFHIDHS